MIKPNHVGPPGQRRSQIALGGFFAVVTAYSLFKDVFDGAPITTNHITSLSAIVGALGAGHFAWPVLRRGNVVAGLALCIMFIASSFYVIVSSAARNAESAQTKVAGAVKANGGRERAEADYQVIVAELARIGAVRSPSAVKAAMDAAPISREVFARTKQCVEVSRSDSFEECRPILELRQEMAAAIRKTELEQKREAAETILAQMGPAVVANGGYKQAARVLATLSGMVGKTDDIEQKLNLFMPFLVVLAGEVGTIAFLGLGLRNGSHLAPAGNDNAQGGDRKASQPKSRRGTCKRDPKVVQFVATFRVRHGRNPTIPEMRAAFIGMASSTAQRYRRAV